MIILNYLLPPYNFYQWHEYIKDNDSWEKESENANGGENEKENNMEETISEHGKKEEERERNIREREGRRKEKGTEKWGIDI